MLNGSLRALNYPYNISYRDAYNSIGFSYSLQLKGHNSSNIKEEIYQLNTTEKIRDS